MKTKPFNTRAGVAVAALVASIGLSTSAKAILFQNLPATTPGDQYVFKLADFDNGTLYQNIAPNTAVGFGQGGASATLAAGTQALDAAGVVLQQAVGAHAIAPFSGGALTNAGLEDSWGIAAVTQIFRASNPLVPIWDTVVDNQELTLMFYGAQDYYSRSTGAGNQTTDSIGLNADFYLQDKALPGYTPFSNLGARPADIAGFSQANDASFPTITDSNGTLFTAGVPVLKLRSTSGFINAPGVLGGVDSEFQTTFNGNALNGSGLGSAFGDVVGGTLAANYNTNSFVSPYIAGKTADISIQFTTTTAGAGPWLVSSQDPLRAVVVPEPTTVLAGLGCMVPILNSLFGRRRKSA